MTRFRGALLALVVVVAGVVGWGVYALAHTQQQARDLGPGLQDPAHLAAARALVDRLAMPAGAVRDPYASACHAETAYCITSTRLSPKQLLAQVTPLVKAAGATMMSNRCYQKGLPVQCLARFELNGTHFGVEAGRGGPDYSDPPTHVAVIVADDSAQAARRSAALVDWASTNPFPQEWPLEATCRRTTTSGCALYQSDRTTVAAPLATAYDQARAGLEAVGYVLDRQRCNPAISSVPANCLLAGFRYRTPGGFDGETVVLYLRTVDATHVSVIAVVSTV